MTAGLQEWIHKWEEGSGARTVKGVAFACVFVALAFLWDLRQFKNFSTPEAMDAAQLARNLAEGRGYTTDFIRPVSLWLLAQHTGDPMLAAHPDLANPPVYPYLLSWMMQGAGAVHEITDAQKFSRHQPEEIIAWLNQSLFALALLLVFRVARRLFDEFVAWTSVCVLAGGELWWRFSASGLPTMLLIVILLAVVWCLAAADQGQRDNGWGGWRLVPVALIAGALVGLGGLTRYSFAWLIVPVVVFFAAWFEQRRFLLVLAALVGFAGVMSPWLKRNHDLCGKPFGIAGLAVHEDTVRFPGNRLQRAVNPANAETSTDLGKVELDEYWWKFWKNLPPILSNDLPKLGGSWVSAFFLAGLLVPFRNPTLSRLRVFLLISLVLFIIVQAMGRTHLTALSPEVGSENLLAVLAPLVIVFGVAMYSLLLDQLNLPPWQGRGTLTSVFVLVASAPLVFALGGPRVSPVAYPPYYPPVVQERAGWLAEGDWLMSDVPWAVAWYGRRQCVWLTWDPAAEFRAVDQRKPVRALYLTQFTLDNKLVSQMWRGEEPEWGRFAADAVVKEEMPAGFPLKFAFTEGFPDQLFMAEKEYWKKAGK